MTELTPDEVCEKVKSKLKPISISTSFNKPPPTIDDITDDRLESAYNKLASIISVHGNEYLPLFIRLHEELESRQQGKDYKKLALAIHEHNSPD